MCGLLSPQAHTWCTPLVRTHHKQRGSSIPSVYSNAPMVMCPPTPTPTHTSQSMLEGHKAKDTEGRRKGLNTEIHRQKQIHLKNSKCFQCLKACPRFCWLYDFPQFILIYVNIHKNQQWKISTSSVWTHKVEVYVFFLNALFTWFGKAVKKRLKGSEQQHAG